MAWLTVIGWNNVQVEIIIIAYSCAYRRILQIWINITAFRSILICSSASFWTIRVTCLSSQRSNSIILVIVTVHAFSFPSKRCHVNYCNCVNTGGAFLIWWTGAFFSIYISWLAVDWGYAEVVIIVTSHAGTLSWRSCYKRIGVITWETVTVRKTGAKCARWLSRIAVYGRSEVFIVEVSIVSETRSWWIRYRLIRPRAIEARRMTTTFAG